MVTQPRKHRHAEMIRAWLDDDSLEVEVRLGDEWKRHTGDEPSWVQTFEYRFKPKMITVGEHSFPEPMRVAPEKSDESWVVCVNTRYNTWRNDERDEVALKEGRVHTTQAAAEQHARALIALTEVKE